MWHLQHNLAQLGSAQPSSAQLCLAQLSTSCHPGKHSSAQLGSTQLSSAWFGLAQLGQCLSRQGRKCHCIQEHSAGGRLPKPRPVPPAPTPHWDRGNTGHGHRQGHPWRGTPCTGQCPQTLLGEHYRSTGLPSSWCLGQPCSVPQCRQARCESLPAAPCNFRANDSGGIPKHFSAPRAGSILPLTYLVLFWGCSRASHVLGGQAPACPSEAWGSPAMQCWVPGPCHLQQLLAGAPCTTWLGGKVLSFPG